MARLPIPGSDDGTWGDILNEFLAKEHNADGSLKTSGGTLDTYATTTYVDSAAAAGTPDATTTTKGKIQLAGDLTGTAASPQIASGVIVDADINASAAIAQSKISGLSTSLSNKQDLDSDLTAIAALTTTSYGRSFLTLADANAALSAIGAIAMNQPLGGDLSGTLPNPTIGAGKVTDSHLAGSISRTKLSAPETWHVVGAAGEPAFGTNWASGSGLGSQYESVGYCLDTATEMLQLKGFAYLTGSLVTSGIFTLPAGYRPTKYRYVTTTFYDSSLNTTYSIALEIQSTGSVVASHPTVGLAANDIIYLDGIRFRL